MIGANTEKAQRLECRIIITHNSGAGTFDMGMYDPRAMRYEALGTHPVAKIDRIVGDLRARIEQERHVVTFSEVTGPR